MTRRISPGGKKPAPPTRPQLDCKNPDTVLPWFDPMAVKLEAALDLTRPRRNPPSRHPIPAQQHAALESRFRAWELRALHVYRACLRQDPAVDNAVLRDVVEQARQLNIDICVASGQPPTVIP
jgi:hypothetical protein